MSDAKDVNIDTLTISVQARANNAGKAIKSLEDALVRLSNVLNQGNLKKLSDLSDHLNKIAGFKAKEIKGLSSEINNMSQQTDKAAKSGDKLNSALGKLKIAAITAIAKRAARLISAAIHESNAYIENMNLFTVSMREFADEALAYAEKVQDALGIDQSVWIRYQGLFNNIATGFGVVSDKAALMSQNLTQIGYDISSFFNISVEEAMNKVRSGISGELEPLRNLGYALDKATLQQIAHSKGISQSVDTMTQAQKSQLRYIAILEQSKNVMGDMARTITTPANAIRVLEQQFTVLKRTLGNMLLPTLQALLPYVQAIVTLITELLEKLSGFKMPEIDYSGLEGANSLIEDTTDALDDATAAAKKFSATIGIDELNIISPNSGTGTDYDAGNAYDLGIDLPSYDFLKDLAQKTADVKDQILAFWDKWGGAIKTAGVALLTYFGASKITKLFTALKTAVGGLNKEMLGGAGLIAAVGLAADGGKKLAKVLAGDGKEGLVGAIAELLGSAWLGALSGGMVGGWIGALIGALGALAYGVGSVIVESKKMRIEMLKTDFYNVQGKAIAEVRKELQEYFQAMDFDTFDKWNQTVETSAQAYDDAKDSFEELWFQLSRKGNWDSEELETLTTAFQNLAQAASEMNKVKFENLFNGLRVGIQNITDKELTGKLESLVADLQIATALTQTGLNTASQNFNDIVSRIVKNGGNVTEEDKKALEAAIADVDAYTLIDTQQEKSWSLARRNAVSGLSGINIGASLSEAQSVIDTLSSEWKAYKQSIDQSTAEQASAMDNLVRLDQRYGWGLGLGEDSISLVYELGDQLKAQVDQQYEDVFKQIADTYYSQYNKVAEPLVTEMGELQTKINSLSYSAQNASAIAYYTVLYNQKKIDLDALTQEAMSLINQLYNMAGISSSSSLHTSSSGGSHGGFGGKFASGGFPTEGQLFLANEGTAPEMVGQFGNRTAVANSQQIVEGIARGVSDANAEQNALLRRQNELLLGILNKDGGNVYLDGTELLRSTEKAAYNRGTTFSPVGVY